MKILEKFIKKGSILEMGRLNDRLASERGGFTEQEIGHIWELNNRLQKNWDRLQEIYNKDFKEDVENHPILGKEDIDITSTFVQLGDSNKIDGPSIENYIHMFGMTEKPMYVEDYDTYIYEGSNLCATYFGGYEGANTFNKNIENTMREYNIPKNCSVIEFNKNGQTVDDAEYVVKSVEQFEKLVNAINDVFDESLPHIIDEFENMLVAITKAKKNQKRR